MFTLVSLCSAAVIRLYCWSVLKERGEVKQGRNQLCQDELVRGETSEQGITKKEGVC